MHEHDPDLIMALAEGSLGDADATAAEAEIATCPQCTGDLLSQRSAVEMLAAAPRVYLSAAESVRLRDAVRGELRLGTARSRRARRPRFSLRALAGAAAVLVAIAIAAPTLNLLGRAGDDAAAPSFEDALAPPTLAPSTESDEPEVAAAPLPPPSPASSEAASRAAQDAAPNLGLAAPAPGPLPGSGLPLLKSSTDLEELRSLFVDGSLFVGQSLVADGGEGLADEVLAEAGLLQTVESTVQYSEPSLVSPVEDAPAEDAPGAAGLVVSTAACDLEAIPGVTAGATVTAFALIDHEGTAALVVAAFGETTEDIQIVVLSIATCEVLDST